MLLKMTVGLSGPLFNLSPGDERDFDDAEAERLVAAGFAVKVEAAQPAPAQKIKKGKADVVSNSGDDSGDK
jgi:hypothetical protein